MPHNLQPRLKMKKPFQFFNLRAVSKGYRILAVFALFLALLSSAHAEYSRGGNNLGDGAMASGDFSHFSVTRQANAGSSAWLQFTVDTGWDSWRTWKNGGGGSNAVVNSSKGVARRADQGGNSDLSVTTTNAKYYTLRLKGNDTYWDRDFVVMETTNSPVTISNVTLNNSTRYNTQNVTVTITTSGTPSSEEKIFVRHTTNAFTNSSLVLATGSGTSWTAVIPGTASNSTPVTFYVLTSTVGDTTVDDDFDLWTLKGNNNSGSNYSYTLVVASAPTITTNSTVSSIATTSATLGGNMTATGNASATTRGFEYSTTNSFADGAGTTTTDSGTYGSTGDFTKSLTGLTANTLYYFKAQSTNPIGTGRGTQQSFTTLSNAPTVGSGSSASAAGFTASWTAPASQGSASFTYSIDVSTNNSTFASPAFTQSSIASGTTTTSVTGLAASTAYYFRVRAVNAAGNSAWSSGSAAVTTTSSATAPAAPTAVTITPGSQNLSVAFTAADNGGSAITNYKYSIDGAAFVALSPTDTTTPITVPNSGTTLTNGQAYNIRILAVNSVGDGTATSNVTATPRTTPGAPTISGITAGNQQLSVAFSAPASNGGDAITNYEFSTNGGSSFAARSPSATASPLVVTGLTNGTSYNVQIRAVNGAGSGTATANSTGTPVAAASVTTSAATNVAGNTVTLGGNITATGGVNPTIRGVEYSTTGNFSNGTGTPVTSSGNFSIGAYTHDITDLNAGTTYYFKAFATNAIGTTYGSQATFATTAANYGLRDDGGTNLPTVTYVLNGSSTTGNGITFNGTTMGAADTLTFNGSNIKIYKVSGGDVSNAYFDYKVWKNTDSEPGSFTTRNVGYVSESVSGGTTLQEWSSFGSAINILSGLTSGTYNLKIQFRIAGTGSGGTRSSGPFAATFAIASAPGTPSTPTSGSVTGNSIGVNWTSVANATNYELDVSTASNFSSFVSGYGNLTTGNVTTTTLSGLSSQATYYIRLRAKNISGTSSSSSTLTQATGDFSFNIASGTTIESSVLSGGGNLTKSGAGDLVLTNTNTFTGNTTITSGTLRINADSGLGAAPGSARANSITIGSGTLALDGAITLGSTRGITLTSTNATIDDYGNNDTYNGTITNSGSAALTKAGGGTLTLGGASTYQGATTVSTGGIEITNASALGASGAGNATTVSSGAVLRLSGGITVSNEPLTLSGLGISDGGALKNVSGNNTWSANLTLGADTRINSDAATLTLGGAIGVGNYSLYLGGAGDATISGAITATKTTGDGALFVDPSGVLTLSGTNNATLTGLVLLRGGTLRVATNANLPAGTLQIGNAATTTTLSITGSSSTHTNNISVENASTAGVINVASGQTFTLSGTVQQTAGGNASTKFGKSGAGTLRLNTASTYAGQIQIGEGTLLLANTTAHGTNTSTLNRAIDLGLNVGDVSQGNNVAIYLLTGVSNNASIYVSPNTSGATRTIGLSGSGSASFLNDHYLDGNATLTGDGGTITFSGGFSNTGGLIISGGTVVLGKANTQSGATSITAGTLQLNIANALQSTTGITVSGGNLTIAASNAVNDSAGVTLTSGTLRASGTVTETLGALNVTSTGTIDMGSGDADLTFASLTGVTTSLAVHNYTNATDSLTFTSNTSWTAPALAKVTFYSDAGSTVLSTGAILNGSQVAPAPSLSIAGSAASATSADFTATYGTASTAQTFAIAGSSLVANLTATAGTGFEVSSDGTTYGATATFTNSSGSTSGTLSVRLASTAAAATSYLSATAATLSSTSATSRTISTDGTGSDVVPKALTITSSAATSRSYNGLAAVTVSGGSLSGVVNSDVVTLGGTPAGTVASAAIGTAKPVTVTGYSISGAGASNYSLTQPTGVTVNITTAALTITANSTSKVYNNALTNPTTGATAFTSSGLQNSETIGSVTLTYSGGYNATDSAGTFDITPSVATAGTFTASNYAITYTVGTLTVTAITPTVTTGSAGTPTTNSVAITGSNVTSGGGASVTARGIAYGTSATPTIANSTTSNGTETGSFDATLGGLTSGTTYYARAYATNSAGTSYGSQISFSTEAEVPAKVALTRADTPVADGFTVRWTDVADETGYHLNYSTNSTFASSVNEVTNISANATSYAISGLTPGTTCYVRVRGVSAGGNGTWSDTQSNQIQSVESGVSRYMSLPGSTASGNYTIADIFGSSNEAGLTSGTTAGNSTVVLLLNGSGGTANTIFYNSIAAAWREGGADAAATNVGAGKAFILQNHSGSTDYFLLVGTPRDVAVQPTVSINNSGSKLTLVTTGRTSTTPLADLNLNPGTGAGQFKAATQPKSADRLIVPPADPTQPVTSYWYHSGNSKWYDGLREVPSAAIPSGQGFFIKKSTDSTFSTWTMPQE